MIPIRHHNKIGTDLESSLFIPAHHSHSPMKDRLGELYLHQMYLLWDYWLKYGCHCKARWHRTLISVGGYHYKSVWKTAW